MKNIFYFLLFCASQLTFAQTNSDCAPCEKVLVQDYLSMDYDDATSLHILNTIDESSYRKRETKSSASLNLADSDIDFGVNRDYNDFQEQRNELKARKEFNYTKEESLILLKKNFSNMALSTFAQCMKGCQNTQGAAFYISSVDSTQISLSIDFKTQPGSTDKLTIERVSTINLKFSFKADEQRVNGREKLKFTDREQDIINFERIDEYKQSSIVVKYSINGKKGSKTITIDPFPKTITQRRVKLTENESGDSLGLKMENIIGGALRGENPANQRGDTYTGHYVKPTVERPIRFGKWTHPDCNDYGSGWHYIYGGSCGKGPNETSPRGLVYIEAWVEDK